MRHVYQLRHRRSYEIPYTEVEAGTLFKDDARAMLWDVLTRRYERSERQDSDDSWPQELDKTQ